MGDGAAAPGSTSGGSDGKPLTRRNVVDGMLAWAFGLTAVATIYPAAAYLVPPESGEPETSTVTLDFSAETLKPNTGRVFKFGGQPGLVLKTPTGEVRAYSAKCTHLSCIVQYDPDSSRILCNCHMGWYDLQGRVLAGPPPRPLDSFTVHLRKRKDSDEHDIVVSRA